MVPDMILVVSILQTQPVEDSALFHSLTIVDCYVIDRLESCLKLISVWNQPELASLLHISDGPGHDSSGKYSSDSTSRGLSSVPFTHYC
jgi:hypothetical protein